MKEQLISQIKEIIKEYGSFTTGEVEAKYDPQITVPGNLLHLIWHMEFNSVEVEVIESGGNSSVDEYDLPYEELEETTLNYILELAEKWKEISIEENETEAEEDRKRLKYES